MPTPPKVPPKGKLLLDDVKDALYDWVKKQTTGLVDSNHIIWRDQSQALPARPCVTMRITTGPTRVGYSDNLWVDANTGKTYVGGQRTLIVSVQIFGSTKIHKPMANQLAVDLNSSLSMPSVLMALRKAGVSVQNQGDVTNITDVEETEFEERYEFSVMLGVAENQVDDPGYFEEIGQIGSTINQ